MILDFFHLREQPFGVTPDPAYLYPSRTHCEALDCLTEGILEGRGFLALIAEPGLGKTTLLYQVLEGLRGTATAAYLFQTQCDSREFFQYLLSELGVDSTGMGLVAMHNKLNELLFAEMLAGRRFVLIVDEAQNLDDSVLETIRLLSNFETPNTKLLQIILAGQPQLAEKLGQKHLEQLLQRITVVKQLEALSPEETAGYVAHRLRVAGHSGEALFDPEALSLIAELSHGIPRVINKICFQALSEAYAEGRQTISPYLIVKANRKLGISKTDRKLGVVAPSRPAPATSPGDPVESAVIPPPTQAAPKRLPKFGSRNWSILGVVLFAILLSASVALPRNTLLEMIHSMRGQVTSTLISPLLNTNTGSAIRGAGARLAEFSKNLKQREGVVDVRQTLGARESAGSNGPADARANGLGASNVTAIQASGTANEARIVVMLDDALQYHSARISSPDRIYFDLYKARLAPTVSQKTVPDESSGEAGLLKWVRAAQNADGVVRLVLDADGAKEYSAQLLSDPYRLVIDLRAQPGDAPIQRAGTDVSPADLAELSSQASAVPQNRLSLTRALGLKINRIAIDAGHGGYDTGTIGPHGLFEKNLCLDVALRLGHLIETNIPDAEVVYTRKDDRHVPLEERAAIANNANADLFVSIHANSSDIREARGVETYYLSLAATPESMELTRRENALAQSSMHELPELLKKITRTENTAESKQLAVNIQSALSQHLQLVSRLETNRGVKQAPFIVLTGANMPAVLSEISFVSNPSDEKLLLESAQRQRVAEGLYRGIATYLESLHSLPHKKDNLFSEIHPSTSSGFATAAISQNPR
jgi:N-acetylmuramoyl-L-alanine amidase/type II secretory pathway predicted ATPase ExeA